MPGMVAVSLASWLLLGVVAAWYWVTLAPSSPKAVRVALMLRSMKGASSDFSDGPTLRKRHLNC